MPLARTTWILCPILLTVFALPLGAMQLVGGTWKHRASYTAPPGTVMGVNSYVVPDCNGDGQEDIAQNDNLEIHLFSSADGSLIRTLDLAPLGVAVHSPSYAGDLDSDGVPDFFLSYLSSSKPLNIVSGATGLIIQSFSTPYQGLDRQDYHNIAAGDVNRDGVDDVLVGNGHADVGIHGGGLALVYSGATGQVLHEIRGTVIDERLGSNVRAAGDLNSDGFDDFFVASRGDYGLARLGYVRLYSGRTGTILWTIQAPPAIFYNFAQDSLELADDLNGDGQPDLLVNSGQEVIVYSTVNQLEIRRYAAEIMLPIADLNGDGWNELARAGSIPALLDGRTGEILQQGANQYLTISGGPVFPNPTVLLVRNLAGPMELHTYHPNLVADATSWSTSVSGGISLHLDFGHAAAGQAYRLLFSGSGIGPNLIDGIQVPITTDAWTNRNFAGHYSSAVFAPTGVLGPQGKALAGLQFQAGQFSALAGRTIVVAAVLPSQGALQQSSAPVQIDLLP